MGDLWQHVAIGLLVVASLVYLGRRFSRWRKRRKACSECRLLKASLERDRTPSGSSR
jgi:hypothetical protein